MQILKDIYLAFREKEDLLFSIHAGETGRGIRVHIEDSTEGLNFKNIIKIEDHLYESEIGNIQENSFDILFPALKVGSYLGEIQIIEGNEILKSGLYRIQVDESLTTENAEQLKEIDSELILYRLSEAEKNIDTKIELMNKAIEGRAGLSAYHIWLHNGNQGTEEDFLNSLKGETPQLNFILDNNGNLFVDIN